MKRNFALTHRWSRAIARGYISLCVTFYISFYKSSAQAIQWCYLHVVLVSITENFTEAITRIFLRVHSFFCHRLWCWNLEKIRILVPGRYSGRLLNSKNFLKNINLKSISSYCVFFLQKKEITINTPSLFIQRYS